MRYASRICTGRLLFKKRPSRPVVFFAVGAGEGGGVGAGDLAGAAGQGVVGDGHGDGGAVFDFELAVFVEVFPAVVAVFGFAVGGGDAGFGGGAAAFAGQADADQAFAVGEDDATLDVVPGVALVALHDRELHAVDELQFVEREAQGLGDQHVDFNQGHAAGVVAA